MDDEALRRAIRERTPVNLIHQTTQLKSDTFVAGGTPLDQQQLSRRQRVTVGSGQSVYVSCDDSWLRASMSTTVKGVYRDGRIVLSENPDCKT